MPVTLNKAGDARACALIAAGKVDADSSWSFSGADGDKLLGDDGDDWSNYGKWFLGEDTGATEIRQADLKPDSYDPKAHTVVAVLSVGAGVQRYYGTEILEISAQAVDLTRLSTCGIPLIDSHGIFSIGGVLGRLQRVWIDSGELLGLIVFDESEAGRNAEGLVARGMIRAVSIGYRVITWEITDDEGNIVDPERERLLWDEQYTFTAKRWQLLEASLVSVPADPDAVIRSAGGRADAPFHDGLLRRAKSVTYRNGDLAITYDFGEVAAAARAASPHDVVERMRARQTMLSRGLTLERSLRALG
jgi:hypothetical protein